MVQGKDHGGPVRSRRRRIAEMDGRRERGCASANAGIQSRSEHRLSVDLNLQRALRVLRIEAGHVYPTGGNSLLQDVLRQCTSALNHLDLHGYPSPSTNTFTPTRPFGH